MEAPIFITYILAYYIIMLFLLGFKISLNAENFFKSTIIDVILGGNLFLKKWDDSYVTAPQLCLLSYIT